MSNQKRKDQVDVPIFFILITIFLMSNGMCHCALG